jgi:tight adherence protein C
MEFLMCVAAAAVGAFALTQAVAAARRRRKVFADGAGQVARRTSLLADLTQHLGGCGQRWAARAGVSPAFARTRVALAAAGIEADRAMLTGVVALRAIAAGCVACLAASSCAGHPIVASALGAAAAWVATGFALHSRARERREAIERGLPFALDMLTLCVAAGLDFNAALARVVTRARRGPLAAELARLDGMLRMGTPRREAFVQCSRHTPSRALSALLALLAQADRLGTGIGPTLRASAARLRAARFARAERRGAAAAQMLLLPLIFCIMPATFIVVFGPLAIRVAEGGVAALF